MHGYWIAYTTCIHAYIARLHTYADMFFSSYGHRFQPVYVCIVPTYTDAGPRAHAENPIFDYFELPFHQFLIQHKSNILFSYFCKFHPRSQVEEALTEWQHGIGCLLLKQWPIFVQRASSQSFIYFHKDLPVSF